MPRRVRGRAPADSNLVEEATRDAPAGSILVVQATRDSFSGREAPFEDGDSSSIDSGTVFEGLANDELSGTETSLAVELLHDDLRADAGVVCDEKMGVEAVVVDVEMIFAVEEEEETDTGTDEEEEEEEDADEDET